MRGPLVVLLVGLGLPSVGHAATFIVTNAGDSGAGSFRRALQDANASPGADVIDCQLTDTTPIRPLSVLPTISSEVTLLGSGCVLDGQMIPSPADGLTINASNVVIRDLVIHSFADSGLWIRGGDDITIEGNILGLGPDGQTDLGNGGDGITLEDATNVVIGAASAVPQVCGRGTQCNVLGGNGLSGLLVQGAFDNVRVAGNFFGSDTTGLLSVPNDLRSVNTDSDGQRLSLLYNVMFGLNGGDWHVVLHSDDGAVLRGNLIGTDRTGSQVPPGPASMARGIYVSSFDGTLPGTGPIIEGNVIAGLRTGIQLDSNARDVLLTANRIGVAADGTDRPNSGRGITITGAQRVSIGDGTEQGANQIVSGTGEAVQISNGSDGVLIRRNRMISVGRLPIDLLGVTENDDGDLDSGPNGLLNSPLVERFNLLTRVMQFQIQGFAPPGSTLDCYVGQPASGFGQADVFLGTFLEGGVEDQAAGTGGYSNRFGTETAAQRFLFRVSAQVQIPAGERVVSCTATTAEGSSPLGSAVRVETVDCGVDADCVDASECTTDSCDVNQQCINEPLPTGTDCLGGSCDMGICVSCLVSGSDCGAGVCITSGPNEGRCGSCNAATDCAAAENPVCQPTTNTCVPCNDPTAIGASCPGGTSCDLSTGRCGLDPNQDSDGDGLSNGTECPSLIDCIDSDGDGISDYLDTDDDGDSIPTVTECPNAAACTDSDVDGVFDYLDPDDDGDGILTRDERLDADTYGADPDLDGQQSYLDRDSDGDGSSDLIEGRTSSPSGVPAYLDVVFLGGGALSGGALHCAVGFGDRSNVWAVTLGLLALILMRRGPSKLIRNSDQKLPG